MNCKLPILTASGGFQVMSLSKLNKIDREKGAIFNSHVDGKKFFLSPEESIRIQLGLNSDIVMIMDECPKKSNDYELIKNSINLLQLTKLSQEITRNKIKIGKVNEVHVWVASTFGGQPRTKGSYDAPNNLNYNLWLGPQKKYTPYHPTHHPFHWRQWWDFAGGTLADIGCHYIDLSHWALNLRHPSKIKVIDGPKPDNEYTPQSLVVDFHYKEIGKQPKTKLRPDPRGSCPQNPLIASRIGSYTYKKNEVITNEMWLAMRLTCKAVSSALS